MSFAAQLIRRVVDISILGSISLAERPGAYPKNRDATRTRLKLNDKSSARAGRTRTEAERERKELNLKTKLR